MENKRTILLIVSIIILLGVVGFLFLYKISNNDVESNNIGNTEENPDLKGYTKQGLYDSYTNQQETIKQLNTEKSELTGKVKNLENEIEGLKIIMNKDNWISYSNESIELSFKYPEQWGKPEEKGGLDEYTFSLQFENNIPDDGVFITVFTDESAQRFEDYIDSLGSNRGDVTLFGVPQKVRNFFNKPTAYDCTAHFSEGAIYSETLHCRVLDINGKKVINIISRTSIYHDAVGSKYIFNENKTWYEITRQFDTRDSEQNFKRIFSVSELVSILKNETPHEKISTDLAIFKEFLNTLEF